MKEDSEPAAVSSQPEREGCAAAMTVLGIGNLIAGDDGFGIHALRELQERVGAGTAPGLAEFVDGGVLGLDLLTVVEAAECLLVLDVVDAGLEPGAIVELSVDQIAAPRSGRLSVHQVAFNDLMALARLRCRLPRDFVLLGVQPASTATSDQLTPRVLAALPPIVERSLQILRVWRALA
jgi:hydrogenase maturation protease